MKKTPLSRRDFLKISWTSLWGLILAACKIETEEIPTATPIPTATDTPVPEIKKDSVPAIVEEEPIPANTPTETPVPCFSLILPEDEAELIVLGRQEFKWEEQLGASSYELEIIIPTYPEGTPVLYKTENLSFAIYLENFRWGGEYLWKVTAFNMNEEIICITEFNRFIKPELQKPSGGNGGGGDDSDGGQELKEGGQWQV